MHNRPPRRWRLLAILGLLATTGCTATIISEAARRSLSTFITNVVTVSVNSALLPTQ